MSEETKKMPINIPIQSGDDDPQPVDSTALEDDVFEIDGDTLEIEPDADDPSPEQIEEDEVAACAVEEPAPVEQEPTPATSTSDATSATAYSAQATPKADAPKQAEISREAVIEMMLELRQKSEAVDRLTQEKNDLYDKLIRKQAEFENFRKRTDREASEAYSRARADILTDILPVLDNFELALMHADATSAEAILEGVQLIFKQLSDTLARFGLDTIDAENQPFDPEFHEAVATEPSDEVPDHTVVAVMQRGYRLGDRLLRPARVKVAVQP